MPKIKQRPTPTPCIIGNSSVDVVGCFCFMEALNPFDPYQRIECHLSFAFDSNIQINSFLSRFGVYSLSCPLMVRAVRPKIAALLWRLIRINGLPVDEKPRPTSKIRYGERHSAMNHLSNELSSDTTRAMRRIIKT